MNRILAVLMLTALLAPVADATEGCGVFSLYEEALPDPFTPLWVDSGDTLYAYHGFDGTVRTSADHGETWDIIHDFELDHSSCRSLFVDSRGTIFACITYPTDSPYYGSLQMGRLEAGRGRAWSEPLAFECSEGFRHMCEDLQGNLFIGEYSNGTYTDTCAIIWRSMDEGTSWEKVYEGTGRHVHFVECDESTGSIYASIGDGHERATLLKSNNHGDSWFEILPLAGLFRQPISIVCTPTHRIFGSDWGDNLWMQNSVYWTDDDVTYNEQLVLTGDENTYVWTMAQDLDGMIFAGTVTREFGGGRPAIYMSLDGGEHWCKAKEDTLAPEPWKGVTWMSNFDSENWGYYHDSLEHKSYRFRAGDPAGIPESAAVASLSAPTPNPSTGRTSLEFSLPSAGRARLAVYDISGRLVRTIADGTFAPGAHPAAWDGTDASGRPVASGVYFVRLDIAGESSGQKLLLVK